MFPVDPTGDTAHNRHLSLLMHLLSYVCDDPCVPVHGRERLDVTLFWYPDRFIK